MIRQGIERGIDQASWLHLDRSAGQYAYISDAAQTGLDFVDAFTLIADVRLASIPTDAFILLSKDVVGDRSFALYLAAVSGGASPPQLNLEVFDAAEVVYRARFNTSMVVDRWYTLAGRLDLSGPSIDLLVDGVDVGATVSGTPPAAVHDSAAPFAIGTFRFGALTLNGGVRNVSAWGRALADSEIAGGPKSLAERRGAWPLHGEEEDRSGNGNTLTLVNGASFVA